MKKILCCILFLAFAVHPGLAQRAKTPFTFFRDGRWSIGFRGGVNLWFNDFDKRKISGGGDFYLRYAFSRKFSLGVMGSYDVLQSKQKVLYLGIPLQYDYMEDKGISADLVAWFYLASGGRFTPYFYFGAGAYRYKRKISGDVYYPLNKNYTTLHLPIGFGLELMLSKYVGFTIDLGARFMDDLTDSWKGNVPSQSGIAVFDWYATGKAGINFYLGSSGSDDNDGDGLTNDEEKALGLDPNNPDSEGDGLRDGEELNIYKSDPKNPDSDGDELKDGEEVNIYKTSPTSDDTDGDGLNDVAEVLMYKSDPLKSDTDGDGFSDRDEVMKYKTDPLKADTDGDGLRDDEEIMIYKTDPLMADTDGGSVNDRQEIANKTNPLDPNDDVPKPGVEIGKAIILEGVMFQSGKAVIEPKSEETLMQALQTMRDNPEIIVEIRGYTDNVGKTSTNQRLSLRRAEAVRFWLIRNGIAPSRISAKGFGPAYPIGDNKTSDGRAKNRRIEFFRTK